MEDKKYIIVPDSTVQTIMLRNQQIMEVAERYPYISRELIKEAFDLYGILTDEMTIHEEYYAEMDKRFASIPTTRFNLLLRNINTYSTNLKKLIDVSEATSDKLEDIFMITEFVKLFSSVLSFIKNVDAIFNYEISNILANHAYGIHPALGLASPFFWNCVPQSMFIRILSSAVRKLSMWWVLRKLLKASNVCKESFEEIREFFQESNQLSEEVKERYSAEWDEELVDLIEKCSEENYRISTKGKIFAFLYVSVLVKTALLHKLDFLTEIFAFSASTMGEQWYKRNSFQDFFERITIKTEKSYSMANKQLSMSSKLIDHAMLPETTINVLGSSPKTAVKDETKVEMKSASPFVFGALDIIFICASYLELKNGSNNNDSALCRNIIVSAQLRLQQMKRIKQDILSRKLSRGCF